MDELSKKYYRIREVSDLTGIPASTLRFWESRFTIITPHRNDRGTRFYTPRDIEIISMIHYLVKDRGLKLEAAQELIRANPEGITRRHRALERLRNIRATLKDLIDTIAQAEKRATSNPIR